MSMSPSIAINTRYVASPPIVIRDAWVMVAQ